MWIASFCIKKSATISVFHSFETDFVRRLTSSAHPGAHQQNILRLVTNTTCQPPPPPLRLPPPPPSTLSPSTERVYVCVCVCVCMQQTDNGVSSITNLRTFLDFVSRLYQWNFVCIVFHVLILSISLLQNTLKVCCSCFAFTQHARLGSFLTIFGMNRRCLR